MMMCLENGKGAAMDLSTNYMGLKLSSPIVPSASPLSRELDAIRRMEDLGAGAVVLWSVFEEQIEHEARELDHYLQYGADRWAESLTYFPQVDEFILGPQEYLDHIAAAKEAVDIPIIASLNGISDAGWTSYAREIEQAGADALELNVYYIPAVPQLTGEHVENVYLSILEVVKSAVSIPIAMKLSPFFSFPGNMMLRLDEAGADALVLFNRFYQPDLDLEELAVKPTLTLSSPFEMRLPLRWIAIMYGQLAASLGATTGIYTGLDVAKMVMAGADVAMLCSALMKHGMEHLAKVRDGLVQFMEEKGYESIDKMKGVLSQRRCDEPAAFERANYMKVLRSYGITATFE